MKLTHVEIENFMGVQSAKFAVGPGGVKFVGESKSGKTSLSLAILAALKSRGYGPEYICDDASQWRVLLKFDGALVETTVRRNGGKKLNVDGLGLGSPQAKVDAVFPDLIDPLKLSQDTPAERRRKILAAMPATATAEDAMQWTCETWEIEEGKHGLEVVKEMHDHYYALRTKANAAVDDAKSALKLAQDNADKLARPEHAGVLVPLQGEEDAPVREAQRQVEALDQRRQQAETVAKRAEKTRSRIAELRQQAEKENNARPAIPADVVEQVTAEWRAAGEEVDRLKNLLAEAEQKHQRLARKVNDIADQNESNAKSMGESAKLLAQARELEATLTETAIAAPTAEEVAAANQAVSAAQDHADLVRSARAAHDALVDVGALVDELEAAKAEAKRLDDIVKRLDHDAPAELAKRANMIPGLSFVDDDIALDGKVFKLLSESEKTELCVDLVKRIAPDGHLLRIDKLEQMDPVTRETFIRKAKRGGWQIIGTVVEAGELRIVGIDSDDEEAEEPLPEPKKPGRLKIIMPDAAPQAKSGKAGA